MNKTQMVIDTQTWFVIAFNTLLVYGEAEPEEDLTEEVASQLELGYQQSGKIDESTLRYVAELANPDTREDDGELGRFAWILDEAVDHFLPKVCA